MKSIYVMKQLKTVYGFAYVDVIDPEFTTWFPEQPACLINKIFVTPERRGCHYGSQLLDHILFDADQEHMTLYLQISPDDDSPLDSRATQEFYGRHGFELVQNVSQLMIRRPA